MNQLIKKARKVFAIHFVMPRFKCWREYDGNKCFKLYYNDKVMRILTKSVCGLHIEFSDVKIHIRIPYVA